MRKNIKPQMIIDIIKNHYNIDISIRDRSHAKANLRGMYFYLCAKYCNPVLYSYREIGDAVQVKHPKCYQI